MSQLRFIVYLFCFVVINGAIGGSKSIKLSDWDGVRCFFAGCFVLGCYRNGCFVVLYFFSFGFRLICLCWGGYRVYVLGFSR